VAETFIHEELTPQENRALRDSIVFHPPPQDDENDNDSDEFHPPGSIDPFLKESELGLEDELDANIEGVSLLATIAERILSRFTFDARDINVTLIHERKSEVILHIDEIGFTVEDRAGEQSEDTKHLNLKMAGLSVALRDLTPSPRQFEASSSTRSPESAFDYDRDENDEEVNMMMSQSIASLPPRSPMSSVYHSAASSIASDYDFEDTPAQPEPDPVPNPVPEYVPLNEQRVLSLGPDPASVQVTLSSTFKHFILHDLG
jgi:autophagy-related protein 2